MTNNRYSFCEFVKTAYSWILTKFIMPQARIIRRPVYIRGIKSIEGGAKLTTGRFCRFDMDGRRRTLKIGSSCEFGDMTHIVAHNNVEIGDHVLIASKCFISDTSHGNYRGKNQSCPGVPPGKRGLMTGNTKIGNNVWIGENVVILAGAKIGDGCVIGANSIITGDIPANAMVVGCNRIIKKFQNGSWKRVYMETQGGEFS